MCIRDRYKYVKIQRTIFLEDDLAMIFIDYGLLRSLYCKISYLLAEGTEVIQIWEFDNLHMTQCAKIIVGFMENVGNVFLSNVYERFFFNFLDVFSRFLTFFFNFHLNVYYIYGVGRLEISVGRFGHSKWPFWTYRMVRFRPILVGRFGFGPFWSMPTWETSSDGDSSYRNCLPSYMTCRDLDLDLGSKESTGQHKISSTTNHKMIIAIPSTGGKEPFGNPLRAAFPAELLPDNADVPALLTGEPGLSLCK